MDELGVAGFTSRDDSSTRMKISNVSSLHTGVCLANTSKQTIEVYNCLK